MGATGEAFEVRQTLLEDLATCLRNVTRECFPSVPCAIEVIPGVGLNLRVIETDDPRYPAFIRLGKVGLRATNHGRILLGVPVLDPCPMEARR